MFKHDPDYRNIEAFYRELREKGVDFPIATASIDKLMEPSVNKKLSQSLKISDEVSTPRTSPAKIQAPQVRSVSSQQNYVSPNRPVGVIKLNDEQWTKLNSELSIVESNVQVFNEILNELQARTNKQLSENDQDLILLREIFKTCKEMQKRITQLIGNISNEGVINELLRINDDLNYAFLRYERFDKSIKVNSDKVAPQVEIPKQEEKALIDFGEDTIDSKLTPLNTNNNNNNSNSKGADGLSFLEDESEIKEMENWLKSQEMGSNKMK